MIVAVASDKKTGRRVYLLGLSFKNIATLMIQNEPIRLTPESHDLQDPIELCIFYGDTEQVILKAFESHGIRIDQLIDKTGEGKEPA